jgi:hypothetical protein
MEVRETYKREIWDSKLSYVVEVVVESEPLTLTVKKIRRGKSIAAEFFVDLTTTPWTLEINYGDSRILGLCVDSEDFKIDLDRVKQLNTFEDVEKFVNEVKEYLLTKVKNGFDVFKSLDST